MTKTTDDFLFVHVPRGRLHAADGVHLGVIRDGIVFVESHFRGGRFVQFVQQIRL